MHTGGKMKLQHIPLDQSVQLFHSLATRMEGESSQWSVELLLGFGCIGESFNGNNFVFKLAETKYPP